MRPVLLATLVAISCAGLRADFSYQESSKMTGGTLYNVLRAGGPFTRKAREAQISTVAVQGNRMVRYDKDSANIIDLDKETFTDINFDKKQYTVVTFADMKKAMEKALADAQKEQKKSKDQAKGKEVNAELKFKVTAKATGKTETINGVSAKEMIVSIETEVKDKDSGQAGSMNVVNDGWMANIAGYQEVKAFELKMAQKLAGMFHPSQAALAMAQPEMVQGMAEAAKEMAKVEGVPVRSIVRMGTGPAEELLKTGTGAEKTEGPSAKSIAGAAAVSAIGGFGGFGRKKEEKPKEEPKQAEEAPKAVLFIETTSELSMFATSVDGTKFNVPDKFKLVESEITKAANKK
jgi:hypothetical protein